MLEQNYPLLEYVVIDGGSDDGSVQIIRRHEEALSHWVSEPDGGQTDALVKGFAVCTGDVLGWLCSDDLLLGGALQRIGMFFAENPQVDWVYGDALWIDARGNPIRPKREIPWSRWVVLFDHNYLAQPSVFWRRSLYDRVGGLDRSWNLSMDADLWLRFARISLPCHLPHYLSCMRDYPEQKTRRFAALRDEEAEALRLREFPGLASLPRLPVRATAKAFRVGMKALAGGYTRSIPGDARSWLQALAIGQRAAAV